MTAAPVIQTASLSKSFGRVDAVRDLNLVVETNKITGFLGRNGAGKSTTIKMLLGLIRPTEGDGVVLGERISDTEANRKARNHIAYVAEDKPLYRYMTVDQTIRFTASFYRDWQPATAKKLLLEFDLPKHRLVKALSKGMRTKLALLLAFSRNPKLLILDEPSEGLDPVMIEQLLQLMVAKAAEGTALFFSSHHISEVERVADQVCILDRGRVALDISMDRLRQYCRRIDIVFPSRADRLEFEIPGVERIRVDGREMSVFVSTNAEAVVERAWNFDAVSVDVVPLGLREMFIELVKGN